MQLSYTNLDLILYEHIITPNEYIITPNSLFRMSTSLLQIARSWFAFAEGTGYTKGLMQKRLAICGECDNREAINGAGEVFIKVLTDDKDLLYRCGICKCPLAGLTAGTSNTCPVNKWRPAGEESYF
jgi:hypothetical protein